MTRLVGTVSRGIRAPIIKEGDDLVNIVVNSILNASKDLEYGFKIHDKDVIAVTEAVVARAQGNYASLDDIALDVKNKFSDHNVAIVFPILSRNRFSMCLKAFARGLKKITLLFSFPSDEVGNSLIFNEEKQKCQEVLSNFYSEEEFYQLFSHYKHRFTNVDYPKYYRELIENEGCECEIYFGNNPSKILSITPYVLNCDIHTRKNTKQQLLKSGAKQVYSLDEIMSKPINYSGHNPNYGLLGSNKATEEKVKLFPINCQQFVEEVQKLFFEKTDKKVEVMIYGDGAFKDPIGGIWELADPVVSPGFTDGLKGTPNEVKLKYLADNEFRDLKGEQLKDAIKNYIHTKDEKNESLIGQMASQGTTPRQLTDLIGSLSDLTSGSGDKGTPIVYIQGYFDNYSK